MDKIKELFSKAKTKNIIIIVLAAAILIETVAFIFVGASKKTETPSEQAQINLNVSIDGLSNELKTAVSSAIDELSVTDLSPEGIGNLVKSVVYSDMIVNTIMSISYPLLFNVLTDLGMMDFATNIDLYPTGPLYAEKIKGSSYTCCDKDGTRKPLTTVLQNVGSDWSYMEKKVKWTDSDGSQKETTLWNSIKWGVTDEESFFKVMGDMSAGLRGVLEICVQSKTRIVNINVVDFLLNTDAVPINLDAATIFNASAKSGYETCLVTLFNALGLESGEYPAPATVCGYTNLSDIWKAILQPVLKAVEKAAADPVNGLTSMLINFANVIESGELVTSMKSLRMDAEFHALASAVMGFQNGQLYNLGDSLIEIIGDLGLDITGSFNNLLDGLLRKITGSSAADMPDMDIAKLKSCASASTRNGGKTYYTADGQKAVDYLIEYAINERIVESIIGLTPLKGTQDAATIITAFGQSKEGIITIAKTLAGLLISKLS